MEFRYYTHHPMADYANSMDPEVNDKGAGDGPPVSIKDVGMSVPMGIGAQNVAGIYSKIRMGAGSLEIQFPGKFQGQRQGMTPGMFGEDQRQALRELANINEVSLTTHSSYGIMGLMGRDERGNFSVNNASQEVGEIKRAIDFAADTAGGGSVVVHTGEWDRPLTDMVINDETGRRINLGWDLDGTGRNMFKKRVSEVIDANFEILDDRDSRKLEQVTKDKDVAYPEWRIAKKTEWGFDQDGNKTYIEEGDYINYEGRKILDENVYDPVKGRVPEFNEKEQRFETRMRHYRYFEEEAREYNAWAKRNWKKLAEQKGFKSKEEFDKNWYYTKMYPEEAYIRATLESNEGYARGWALQFSAKMNEGVEHLQKLRKAQEFYEKLDKELPESEKWKMMKQDPWINRQIIGDFVPAEAKNPIELVKKAIKDAEASLEYERLSGYTQEQQAQDTAASKDHLIAPIKRFEKITTGLYARAAIHAIQKSKDPNNPVVMAIENLFPERFGGHPEELKWIIHKVRERVVEYLTEDRIMLGEIEGFPNTVEESAVGKNPFHVQGMSKEEAEKIAETHVKATFDTGHANMWKKFFVEKPGNTPEQNDADFKEWYLKQFKSLADAKMIGNMHLADNLGYWDDHLAPGQGNAPIKEVMDILKKNGYDKALTVEPGADASTDLSDFHGLMKTWNYLGSPIYGMGAGPSGMPQTWSQVHNSYFGQNQPPNYIFGSYSPSQDWTLWSQVPLE
ncbi:MAG: TIM barrel protein [Nanoarchaeota archaeon]|nr:TIM barrel protein [Nanoarchaeota archaeon]